MFCQDNLFYNQTIFTVYHRKECQIMYKLDNHNKANDMHPSPHSKTGNNPVKTIQYNPLETVYFKTNYNINISVL